MEEKLYRTRNHWKRVVEEIHSYHQNKIGDLEQKRNLIVRELELIDEEIILLQKEREASVESAQREVDEIECKIEDYRLAKKDIIENLERWKEIKSQEFQSKPLNRKIKGRRTYFH